MALPASMLALELRGSGPQALFVAERPVPRPGPSQLLCKVHAASVCASDGKLVRLGARHRNLHGWDPARQPLVVGHEGSLEVVEAGARLSGRFALGQRLVVAPNLPGPPRFDLSSYGEPAERISRISVGFTLPGLLAQYVLLREDVLDHHGHLIPVSASAESLPHFAAALAEPLSTVVAAHAHMVHVTRGESGERAYRAGVLPGGTAVVVGAGPMGLLHLAYSLARRPRTLLVSEPVKARREAAAGLAERAAREGTRLEVVEPAALAERVRASSGGRGADDVVVTAGIARVEEEAISLAAPGGCVSFFGSNPPEDDAVRVSAADLHYRSITVSGTSGGEPLDLKRALDLLERGSIDLAPLVSAVGGMEAAGAAVRGVLEARFSGKVVIYPHSREGELFAVTGWGPEAEAVFLKTGSPCA